MPILSAVTSAPSRTMLALLPLVALAACGGHSSPATTTATSVTTVSNPFWNTAANIGVSYKGTGQSASISGSNAYSIDTVAGSQITIEQTSTTSGSTTTAGVNFTATDIANTTTSSSGVVSNTTTVALTQAADSVSLAGLAALEFSGSTTANTTVNLFSFGVGTSGYSAGLSYSDFGIWNVTTSASVLGNVGAYALGTITPTASVPTSGSAVYTGSVVGYVASNGALSEFSGPVSLTASFAANTISGGTTTISVYPTGTSTTSSGTMNNLNFTGTITGNSFAGAASTSTTQGTAANISGATGTFAGNFFGPAAQEAAGTFQLTGPSTTATNPNPNTVIGSFGTHK